MTAGPGVPGTGMSSAANPANPYEPKAGTEAGIGTGPGAWSSGVGPGPGALVFVEDAATA